MIISVSPLPNFHIRNMRSLAAAWQTKRRPIRSGARHCTLKTQSLARGKGFLAASGGGAFTPLADSETAYGGSLSNKYFMAVLKLIRKLRIFSYNPIYVNYLRNLFDFACLPRAKGESSIKSAQFNYFQYFTKNTLHLCAKKRRADGFWPPTRLFIHLVMPHFRANILCCIRKGSSPPVCIFRCCQTTGFRGCIPNPCRGLAAQLSKEGQLP